MTIKNNGKGWLYKLRDKIHQKSQLKYKYSSKANESIQAGPSFINDFRIDEEDYFTDEDFERDKQELNDNFIINLQISKS